MDSIMSVGLSNAAVAIGLAVFVSLACRVRHVPAIAHGLWVIVLVKLVTPPLLPVAIPAEGARQSGSERSVVGSVAGGHRRDLAAPGSISILR